MGYFNVTELLTTWEKNDQPPLFSRGGVLVGTVRAGEPSAPYRESLVSLCKALPAENSRRRG